MTLFATLISNYTVAAEDVAERRHQIRLRETALDQTRVQVAQSLIGQNNPLTSRPHSWSSAIEAAGQTEIVVDAERSLVELRYQLELREISARAASYEYWATVADTMAATPPAEEIRRGDSHHST